MKRSFVIKLKASFENRKQDISRGKKSPPFF